MKSILVLILIREMDRDDIESLSLSDIELGDLDGEDFGSYYSDTEPEPQVASSSRKIAHSYPWLSKISTINLDLCGELRVLVSGIMTDCSIRKSLKIILILSGSDLSQRIELSCPNGPSFKTDLRKLRDLNGIEIQDQKQFTLLNHRNEKLLTVDFSKVVITNITAF